MYVFLCVRVCVWGKSVNGLEVDDFANNFVKALLWHTKTMPLWLLNAGEEHVHMDVDVATDTDGHVVANVYGKTRQCNDDALVIESANELFPPHSSYRAIKLDLESKIWCFVGNDPDVPDVKNLISNLNDFEWQ